MGGDDDGIEGFLGPVGKSSKVSSAPSASFTAMPLPVLRIAAMGHLGRTVPVKILRKAFTYVWLPPGR
jgi:hypothetical protein